jgi:hypothetical protein
MVTPPREPKGAPPDNRGATSEVTNDEGRGRAKAPGGERGNKNG